MHDAGIDDHIEITSDLAHHVGEKVKRDRGSVELSATVVGQHDAVHADVGQPLRPPFHRLSHLTFVTPDP